MFNTITGTIEIIDKRFGLLIVVTTLNTIYLTMFSVFVLTIINEVESMRDFKTALMFNSTSCVIQLIASCFICGRVWDKCADIMSVLDDIRVDMLSERERKEWLMFVNVVRNTRTFGFTIGGFAALNKSALIAVIRIIELN